MLPPTGNHSRTVIFVSQPARSTVVVLWMNADFCVGNLWSGAQPHVKIQIGRHRHCRSFRAGRITRQTYSNGVQLTYPPISHQLRCQAKLLTRPLLRTQLQHHTGSLDYFHQLPSFMDGQRGWFLKIDVLPCKSCLHGGL